MNLFNTKIRSTKYRYSLNYCISLPIGISFFDKDTYVAFNLYIADSVPPSLIDALEIEIYKENKRVSDITKQYKNDSLWMYLALSAGIYHQQNDTCYYLGIHNQSQTFIIDKKIIYIVPDFSVSSSKQCVNEYLGFGYNHEITAPFFAFVKSGRDTFYLDAATIIPPNEVVEIFKE